MAIHVNCVVKSLLCDYVRLFIHRRKCSYTCCEKNRLNCALVLWLNYYVCVFRRWHVKYTHVLFN